MANLELKSLRVRHGLSQDDMAKFLQVTVTTYNRKENGVREFSVSEAGKIAELFGITIEQIFFTSEVTKRITTTA